MRKPTLAAVALLAGAAGVAAPALALEITANGGWMSEYIFRGVHQDDSSAMGGVDLKTDQGFYLGNWDADVGQGLETDFYGGYNGSYEDFTYGIGATGYFYTDNFDDTYYEANFSAGYKIASVAVAVGRYKNFSGPTLDYTFLQPRLDYKGFYATAGFFFQDFGGEYYEIGYQGKFDPIGVDYKLSAVRNTQDLGTDEGVAISKVGSDADTSITLTLSKSFGIYKD